MGSMGSTYPKRKHGPHIPLPDKTLSAVMDHPSHTMRMNKESQLQILTSYKALSRCLAAL